jgi:hypothetical protein
MMRCLYRDDYGPADPGFNAQAQAQLLAKDFPAYTNVLATADNPRQMAALLRRLQHGDSVAWCEAGYGWVQRPAVTDGFTLAATFILLPVACWRFARWMRRRGY